MSEYLENVIFQAGKCVLTNRWIFWKELKTKDYRVEIDEIWQMNSKDKSLFELPIQLSTKTWLKDEDFKDFMIVFAFAIDYRTRPDKCKAHLYETLLELKLNGKRII